MPTCDRLAVEQRHQQPFAQHPAPHPGPGGVDGCQQASLLLARQSVRDLEIPERGFVEQHVAGILGELDLAQRHRGGEVQP